jgi:hypothetical protein
LRLGNEHFSALSCGAGFCFDLFHAMQLLEREVAADPAESPEGRGEVTHDFAVRSYVLQQSNRTNNTAEALAELQQIIADDLFGQVRLANGPLKNALFKKTDGRGWG